MSLSNFLRSFWGCPEPTDPEGIANKSYVDAAIATAVDNLDISGQGGLYGVAPTVVTHTSGDLALDFDGGAQVFDIDMQANITGTNRTNRPSGYTLVAFLITNSTGSSLTLDLTGEIGLVPYGELASVVTVPAGGVVEGYAGEWV